MPRFFFHVHGDDELPDDDGLELASVEEARIEGIRYAGYALADQAQDTRPDDTWAMDVADESGAVLFSLTFSIKQRDRQSEGSNPDASGLPT